MISVVVLTLNEAVNLERCLASVRWSDDVLVLDSGSTDETVKIAQNAGARVMTRAFDTFAGQRNYAMEAGEFRHRWVLHLDADEVVTDELREELLRIAAIQDEQQHLVYRVPFRLIFMASWLRHAGMYPSYQVRFGRKESLRFVDYGHGQRETESPDRVGTLVAALDHHNFSKGVNDWFERHLRYAEAEARQSRAERGIALPWSQLWHRDTTLRRRALKRVANRMPLRPLLRFLYVYFFRLGFLDGRAGFRYAVMLGIYQHLISLNEMEQDHAARSDS